MEFKKINLKDTIISANTGADAIQRAPIVDYDTGKKCLRIGDISNRREYKEWGFTKVNDENYQKYKLEKNDILIARTGSSIGINHFIDRDLEAVYNNGLIRLKINKEKYNSKYIYYTLQTSKFKKFIESIAFGTTGQPNMKINDLLTFKILDIPLERQNKLVDIMDNLDKKIELNNQINNNLYELGDAIYKEFILDKYDTTNKLSNLYKFQYGKGNNNPSNGGKYPVYGSNGVIGYYDEFNNEDAPVIGHIGANCGSLIFAYGKHYVTYNGIMCNIINRNYRYFGYETLRFLNIKREIRGSSQPFISYDLLNSFDIPLPQNTIIVNIESKLKTIYTSIKNNLDEINTLMQLRDTLLPKLMKGEIDLNEIEA